MRILRIVVVAVALVACAWFVLGIRQAHEIARATSLITVQPHPSTAQMDQASAELHSARVLDPDAEVDILRGRLALAEHQPGRAQKILEDVTRREPMNLEAWIWLAGVSLTNERLAQVAIDHVHELDPRSAVSLSG